MADKTKGTDSFDVIVIGSGPGGYVAAIRAAQLGMKVACIEADKLGGVCNNVGCIPTKALLESANFARRIGELGEFGIQVGEVRLDLAAAGKRSKKVAQQGERGVAFLFKKNGVEHVQGWGRLSGGKKVTVKGNDGERVLEGKHIILATGSRAKDLPMLKADGERVWNSDHAVFPNAAPESLAVIGAGAVGMEFADVYASFGVKVTVIEALDRILPLEDPDASAAVQKSFQKRGIEAHTAARLEKAEVGKSGVRLTVQQKSGKAQTFEVERVLVAVGRAPIVEDIGVEAAGVKLDRGFIAVDVDLRTSIPGVYAIGDVARPPLLAHKASHEGIAVVESLAGHNARVDYDNIPNVTYCHPEVASVGLSEPTARERGFDVEVGVFPWSASGRARTAGETEGFVKVIRDKRYSELLGAHIVGPHASELIAEFVLGRHLEATAEEMDRAIHPHPTLSEAVAEGALASLGRPIHI